MLKRYIIPAVLLLAALVAIIAVFPTDTRRVKRRIYNLAKWVTKSPEESNVVMVAKLNNLKGALAETCRLHVPAEDISGSYERQDVVQRIAGARTRLGQLDIAVTDLRVTLAPTDTAIATFTGTITGISSGDDAFREIHEVVCTLQKHESGWLLTDVEIVEVLQK